ncbi:MAG: type II toxin-antitoxin system VapC family toxin [Chloroflexota bacterium]
MLDSSGALAYLQDEPGGDEVLEILGQSVISAVNWSEILQKSAARGVDPAAVISHLLGMGLTVVPFGAADAETAAGLWTATRAAGLSLGDRACLALAQRLAIPAVTADRAWARLDAFAVRVIR